MGPEATLLEQVLAADEALLELFRIEVVESTDERTVLRTVPRPELVNSVGVAHGSLAFTLADTAAAYAMVSRGLHAVTISANVSFTGPARAGSEVLAEARVESAGKQLGTVTARVTSGERLVAHGTFQFFILSEGPS
jgi:acyl-CoA thioesterase